MLYRFDLSPGISYTEPRVVEAALMFSLLGAEALALDLAPVQSGMASPHIPVLLACSR